VISCRYRRVVARDNTVRLGPRVIQIPRGPHGRSYARRRVEVRELLDGRVVVRADTTVIAVVASPSLDFTLVARRAPGVDRRRASPPSPSLRTALNHLAAALPQAPAPRHPWRRAYKSTPRRPRRLHPALGMTFSRGSTHCISIDQRQ
jgi:hypothetical protein